MSARELAIAVLLVLGTGVVVLSVLGMTFTRRGFDRLHWLGPVNLAAIFFVLALALKPWPARVWPKLLILLLLLFVSGPMVVHAVARATRNWKEERLP